MILLYFGDRHLFDLSLVMAKVDFLAFGGGYGSIPLMFNEVVGVQRWLDGKTFMDGIALGQITPGPIVITATFVGYLIALVPGALVGTVSIFTPSLIMLTLAVPYADRIQNNLLFQRAMHGILVSFVGLLLSVTIHFILTVHWGVAPGTAGDFSFSRFTDEGRYPVGGFCRCGTLIPVSLKNRSETAAFTLHGQAQGLVILF